MTPRCLSDCCTPPPVPPLPSAAEVAARPTTFTAWLAGGDGTTQTHTTDTGTGAP